MVKIVEGESRPGNFQLDLNASPRFDPDRFSEGPEVLNLRGHSTIVLIEGYESDIEIVEPALKRH